MEEVGAGIRELNEKRHVHRQPHASNYHITNEGILMMDWGTIQSFDDHGPLTRAADLGVLLLTIGDLTRFHMEKNPPMGFKWAEIALSQIMSGHIGKNCRMDPKSVLNILRRKDLEVVNSLADLFQSLSLK